VSVSDIIPNLESLPDAWWTNKRHDAANREGIGVTAARPTCAPLSRACRRRAASVCGRTESSSLLPAEAVTEARFVRQRVVVLAPAAEVGGEAGRASQVPKKPAVLAPDRGVILTTSREYLATHTSGPQERPEEQSRGLAAQKGRGREMVLAWCGTRCDPTA
jgi:hypothetical protein